MIRLLRWEAKIMLKLLNIDKTFNIGTINEKHVLKKLNLEIDDGDFITVIGGNGAGKSTMLNIISGVHISDGGRIMLNDKNITYMTEVQRAKYFGRVFQDPMMGTAPNMSIEENLAMAYRRTKKRGFGWGITNEERKMYKEKISILGLGLEDRMTSKVGLLSGGQRQAVTLLMATLQKPEVLLLDEHTAALDPKTAANVLKITKEIVDEDKITTLMITHNMHDAITIGNRLIMMDEGHVALDISGEEKQNLTVETLLSKFEKASGNEFTSDKVLLS